MSISDSLARLKQSYKKLDLLWSEMAQGWRDENRRRFENDYISPLRRELKKCESAMEHMDNILHRVRSDCE